MNESERPEFALLLGTVAVTLGHELTKPQLDGYWIALQHLCVEQLRAACHEWMRCGRWFPKPVELIELVEGSALEQAELAWLQANREVQRVGYRGSPEISDSASIRAIESCGGWEYFCGIPERESPFIRKRFAEAYVIHRRIDSISAEPLIGEIDRLAQKKPARGLRSVGEAARSVAGHLKQI